MTRTRRCDVFEADAVGVYHCYNRIVRRSCLCGLDPHSGNDYPDLVEAMSDRDVASAWLMICPKSGRKPDETAIQPTEGEIRMVLSSPEKVQQLRERLSDPSWLMRQLCQYMGTRCNAGDQMHFQDALTLSAYPLTLVQRCRVLRFASAYRHRGLLFAMLLVAHAGRR